MTNKPMLSVERELLELVTDNKHIDKESISIRRWEALCKLRAILSKPATQNQGEPVVYTQFLTDVMTAAGLVAHGKQDKKFAERLADECARLQAEQPVPVAVVIPEREALRDLISEAIGGDTYDCTRVWTAWGVGTMSEDDFVSVVEQEDRLYEIADSFLAEVARLNGVKP